MGEFDLIAKIRSRCKNPAGITGIGDDCAVLPQTNGNETLVSTDMLVEDIHFLFDQAPPYDIGWKSAAVNISDIAAMGGLPKGIFLSFALPKKVKKGWADSFLDGFLDLCSRFDCPLLGGDTCSSSDKVSISVTVVGECPKGKSVKRNGAKSGDLVCVSGYVGGSGTGLKSLLEGCPDSLLLQRHYRPVPQVSLAVKLRETGIVHSMIDISDGIASDLRHILDESRKGARINVSALPVSAYMKNFCARKGWDPIELALCGGEDYELLFTIAFEDLEKAKELGNIFVIGTIDESNVGNIEWIGAERDYFGYTHLNNENL